MNKNKLKQRIIASAVAAAYMCTFVSSSFAAVSWSGNPTGTATVGENMSIDLSGSLDMSSLNGTATYTLSSANNGFSINGTTLEGVPTSVAPIDFTVSADDDNNSPVEKTFTITPTKGTFDTFAAPTVNGTVFEWTAPSKGGVNYNGKYFITVEGPSGDVLTDEEIAAGTTSYDLKTYIAANTSVAAGDYKATVKTDASDLNWNQITSAQSTAITLAAPTLAAQGEDIQTFDVGGSVASWDITSYFTPGTPADMKYSIDKEIPGVTIDEDGNVTGSPTTDAAEAAYIISATNGVGDAAEKTVKVTVNAAQLSAPTGLSWDGTTAKWGKVDGATGYTVTLNDGQKDTEVTAATNEYDFAQAITAAGSYTFKVVAKGDGKNSTDSQESTPSRALTAAAPIVDTISDVTAYKGVAITPIQPTTNPAAVPAVTAWDVTGLPTGLTFDTATGKISGTVAENAETKDYTVTVKATNAVGDSADVTFDITVSAADVTLKSLTAVDNNNAPVTITKAADGVNYEALVAAGVTSIDVTATANAADAQVAVNGQAAEEGVSTQTITLNANPQTINIVVTDANDQNATMTYTLKVVQEVDTKLTALSLNNNLTLDPAFDPAVTSYKAATDDDTITDVTITATAGAGTNITYNGEASSTVALNPGVNTITVTVANTNLPSNKTDYTITITTPGGGGVTPPVQQETIISTESLPDPELGRSYSANLYGTGSGMMVWSVSKGKLPTGLTLGLGKITGIPTEAGTYTFTIQLKSNSGTAEKEFTLVVKGSAPIFTVSALADATVNQAYTANITAEGTTPITMEIVEGALPAGLTFNNGAISGTPTAEGVFTFTVKATNADGEASRRFRLTVVGEGGEVPTLSAPTGFGMMTSSANSVKLVWNKNNADRYYIYRSTSANGPFEYLGWRNVRTNYFVDTTVAAGQTYYYQLRGATVDTAGKVTYGAPTAAIAVTAQEAWRAPVGLKASNITGKSVRISFAKVDGAERYALYKSYSKNGPYVYAGWLNGKTNYINHFGMNPGRNYYFKVTAGKTVNGKMTFNPMESCKTIYVRSANK